jgi:hypothetical protein
MGAIGVQRSAVKIEDCPTPRATSEATAAAIVETTAD